MILYYQLKGRDISVKNLHFEKRDFIECPQIVPNSGIKYKIIGLLSEITDLNFSLYKDFFLNHKDLFDELEENYNQWLIIKKGN
jgi:hypothetical protein